MKVWITKYALTKGVYAIQGGIYQEKYFTDVRDREFFRAGEWHTTHPAAIAKAEAMRIAKIASLEKQIAKLEKMTFTTTETK